MSASTTNQTRSAQSADYGLVDPFQAKIEALMRSAVKEKLSFLERNRVKSKRSDSSLFQPRQPLAPTSPAQTPSIQSSFKGAPSTARPSSSQVQESAAADEADFVFDGAPSQIASAEPAPAAAPAAPVAAQERYVDALDRLSDATPSVEQLGTRSADDLHDDYAADDEEPSLSAAASHSADEPECDESLIDEYAKQALTMAASGSASDADSSRFYLNQIAKFRTLSQDEFLHYLKLSREGDDKAFEKLVNHNLRLVISVVRHYLHRGLPFDDLVQEGNMGLMRGIQKYDPSFNHKPSTYLWTWIRQPISRAVSQKAGVIRIPSHVHDAAAELHREAKEAAKNGAENAEELARKSQEAYYNLNAYRGGVSSLDATDTGGRHDEGNERSLGDMLIDEASDVEGTVARRETIRIFFQGMMELSERSRFIVAAKCDLLNSFADELELESWIDDNNLTAFVDSLAEGDGSKTSLREIGDALGLTSERVNQIYRSSMLEIRNEICEAVEGVGNLFLDNTNGFSEDAFKSKPRISA